MFVHSDPNNVTIAQDPYLEPLLSDGHFHSKRDHRSGSACRDTSERRPSTPWGYTPDLIWDLNLLTASLPNEFFEGGLSPQGLMTIAQDPCVEPLLSDGHDLAENGRRSGSLRRATSERWSSKYSLKPLISRCGDIDEEIQPTLSRLKVRSHLLKLSKSCFSAAQTKQNLSIYMTIAQDPCVEPLLSDGHFHPKRDHRSGSLYRGTSERRPSTLGDIEPLPSVIHLRNC